MFDFAEPIFQPLKHPILDYTGVKVGVKRLDLIDPVISGNKWYKLKYNLEEAKRLDISTILSFGGAFSNHIYALAATGKRFGLNTIGIIRGEETLPLNSTLQFAKDSNMTLEYVDRETYGRKNESGFLEHLKTKFGEFYMIPEGGSNLLGVKGCTEILTENDIEKYDVVCCCCGTGATIAGIIIKLNYRKNAIGFSVLKGDFMKNEIDILTKDYAKTLFNNYSISSDYHFGGYAKTNDELNHFILEFTRIAQIPVEHVYTAKMFYGILDMAKQGIFKSGTKILAIHSGGLRKI